MGCGGGGHRGMFMGRGGKSDSPKESNLGGKTPTLYYVIVLILFAWFYSFFK